RKQLCAGGFVESADASPQINFPRGVHVSRKNITNRAGRRRGVSASNIFSTGGSGRVIYLWKKSGSRLRRHGSRLFNARDGEAQIVIVHERGANQILQRVVVEDLPPWKIGE